MRMHSILTCAGLAIGTLIGAATAQAATYDLSADYSDTANPTGTWSYHYNSALLPHVGAPATFNVINPAISSNGYFSTANDINIFSPDVFKAQVNGASVGYSD